MLDFNELRELAADVRVFVDIAEDKAEALRAVITAYDVVLAIFPSGEGMGLHVIKGGEILDRIANSRTNTSYSHHSHCGSRPGARGSAQAPDGPGRSAACGLERFQIRGTKTRHNNLEQF
ncbi:hypothetical protein ACVWZL_003173 [Bradyrhizobium sp. GM2.4]